MKRFKTKKIAAVVLTAGLVLGGGGIAFAYFTSTGSGTGSAQVGTPSGVITFASTGPATPLLPDDTPVPFDFHMASNQPGGTMVYVGNVYLSIMRSGTGPTAVAETADGTPISGCLADWFTVTSSVFVDIEFNGPDGALASDSDGLTLPTIEMMNQLVSQDACQGASIGIGFNMAPPVG